MGAHRGGRKHSKRPNPSPYLTAPKKQKQLGRQRDAPPSPVQPGNSSISDDLFESGSSEETLSLSSHTTSPTPPPQAKGTCSTNNLRPETLGYGCTYDHAFIYPGQTHSQVQSELHQAPSHRLNHHPFSTGHYEKCQHTLLHILTTDRTTTQSATQGRPKLQLRRFYEI